MNYISEDSKTMHVFKTLITGNEKLVQCKSRKSHSDFFPVRSYTIRYWVDRNHNHPVL